MENQANLKESQLAALSFAEHLEKNCSRKQILELKEAVKTQNIWLSCFSCDKGISFESIDAACDIALKKVK